MNPTRDPVVELSNGLAYLREGAYHTEDRPLWYHTAGLTQTSTGYGSKLTTARVVRLIDGRVRRVYVTRYSNAGSAWIRLSPAYPRVHVTGW